MAIKIENLIAAINPSIFCQKYIEKDGKMINLVDQVKKTAKEKGYAAAAEIAKLKECSPLNFDDYSGKSVLNENPFKLKGLKSPIEKHFLEYDSFGENLEPIYFWIIDSLNREYKDLEKIDKLVDNFISSPGSGHFSEIGAKATRMQEEGMKILGAANQVIKSILNLIYDLKEFKIRVDLYDQLRSKDNSLSNAAKLSLKQIWIDTVDAKRGNTSIKALALGGQSNFVTLIDAFMATDDLKSLDKLDLNDRVKRIVEQRIAEYQKWVEESEKELRKRYEIERAYLKSQVNTVQLYARWAKPYLKAARQLEQNATETADLVSNFNTTLFELTLLGQAKYKPEDDVNSGNLPDAFKKIKLRKYVPLILIELKFRSIPERAGQQGYGFRGKVEINFTGFALSEDEVKILKNEIRKDDFGDIFSLIDNATSVPLEQIKEDVESFLNDSGSKDKKEKSSSNEDTNPFSALFSFAKKDKEKAKKDNPEVPKKIEPDSEYEKVCRSQALIKARQNCLNFYELYKKSHGMPSF